MACYRTPDKLKAKLDKTFNLYSKPLSNQSSFCSINELNHYISRGYGVVNIQSTISQTEGYILTTLLYTPDYNKCMRKKPKYSKYTYKKQRWEWHKRNDKEKNNISGKLTDKVWNIGDTYSGQMVSKLPLAYLEWASETLDIQNDDLLILIRVVIYVKKNGLNMAAFVKGIK